MQNIYNPTGVTRIATVTAVDIIRGVCKCVGDDGEVYNDTRWVVPTGGGDGYGASFHPVENNRVLVDTSTGFPIIMGTLLLDSTAEVLRQNIAKQDVDEEDLVRYSTVDYADLRRGPGTPRDQRVGDQIFTTEGGGIFGALRSGTFLAKASSLCQIVLSRFGDLARIVSRNFELFTDIDSLQKVSVRGHLYTLRNLYRTGTHSREERPVFTRLEGQVAAGEVIGSDYAAWTTDNFPAIPDDDFVVAKETYYNFDDTGIATSTWTIDLEGKEVKKVQTTDEANIVLTTTDNLSTTVQYTTADSESTYNQDALQFHYDIIDKVTVDGNKDGVIIKTTNDSDTTTITINSDGTLILETTGDATMDYQGNLKIDVGGTTDLTSVGNITMTAPLINLNN